MHKVFTLTSFFLPLSDGCGFHLQDKSNLLIQTAVHFNVPLDIYQSNEVGIAWVITEGSGNRGFISIIRFANKIISESLPFGPNLLCSKAFPPIYWKAEKAETGNYKASGGCYNICSLG